MEHEELEQLIQKETEKLTDKAFNLGIIAGWNACLINIKKEISPIRSAKTIKKMIDDKIESSKQRIENNNIEEEK